MIRYPFLIDQVLIRNPRNGTNIVLSRDEARRLYEQLEGTDMITKRKIHCVLHNAEWVDDGKRIQGEAEADVANAKDGSVIVTGAVTGRWRNVVHTTSACYFIASWKSSAMVDDALVETVAKAIYETCPQSDQDVDCDGRPTSAAFTYSWQDVKDSLPATYEAAYEAALAGLRNYFAK